MAYRVRINKRALKVLDKLHEPSYSKIKKAISNLMVNPRPQGYIILSGREGYRIRVGNYRIIYEIFDNELRIIVIAIGHRKNIYQ